jgi:hypothetical protein
LWVAVITAGAGLVFGPLAAVLVGVVLTLGLVLHELTARGVGFWFTALTPHVLSMVSRLPRWGELQAEGRLFPTALAAIRHYETTQRVE